MIEKEDIKGYINTIIKSSIVDGPGNRIAIFMQGCNFNCFYCHNKETIPFDKNVIIHTPQSLYNEISKYFSFVDGITFSGGEALLQQEFVYQFFKLIKENTNLTCFIDTNGSVDIMPELIEITDYFMLDVKVVDNQEHLDKMEYDVTKTLENLDILNELDKLYEVRTVLYPGYDHSKTFEYVNNHIKDNVIYKKIVCHFK